MGRHARRQIKHLLIKKRNAHFEVSGHRGLVSRHQVQARKKRLQIDVQKLIQRRRILHSCEVVTMHAIRIHAARCFPQLVGVKPRLRFIGKISFVTQVAILEIQRRTACELLCVA